MPPKITGDISLQWSFCAYSNPPSWAPEDEMSLDKAVTHCLKCRRSRVCLLHIYQCTINGCTCNFKSKTSCHNSYEKLDVRTHKASVLSMMSWLTCYLLSGFGHRSHYTTSISLYLRWLVGRLRGLSPSSAAVGAVGGGVLGVCLCGLGRGVSVAVDASSQLGQVVRESPCSIRRLLHHGNKLLETPQLLLGSPQLPANNK